MKQREYEITIRSDGSVEIHVQGHKGKACVEVAKAFAEIVGEMESQRLTTEYYDPEEKVQWRMDQRLGQ